MTAKQKIEVKKGEKETRERAIKKRINEILGLDESATTAEIRTERDSLMTESRAVSDAIDELETQRKAAILAAPETETRGTVMDSETRERVELRSKSSVVNYLRAAVEMRSVKDAEADYNASLGMGSDQFPLEMLAPPEVRQTTDTDTMANQGSWLDRLFEATAAGHIGVTFNSVGPGVASFPVTTAGATAEQQAKSEAASAAAWTVSVSELKPKRNAVHAIFSIEDAARIGPGLEDALQRDLRMALVEGIDRAIFKGDSTPTGTDADIVGFQSAGISENTLTQANKIKGDKILELLAAYINGKHAVSPEDLRIVASVGTNVLWLTKLQAAAVDNMTIAQFLSASGISWTTRGAIDTATSNGDFGAYIGLGVGIEGAAVAAVWENASLVRDPYSGASKGEVGLVLNTLWDFAIPRTSNFKRLKYVT